MPPKHRHQKVLPAPARKILQPCQRCELLAQIKSTDTLSGQPTAYSPWTMVSLKTPAHASLLCQLPKIHQLKGWHSRCGHTSYDYFNISLLLTSIFPPGPSVLLVLTTDCQTNLGIATILIICTESPDEFRWPSECSPARAQPYTGGSCLKEELTLKLYRLTGNSNSFYRIDER